MADDLGQRGPAHQIGHRRRAGRPAPPAGPTRHLRLANLGAGSRGPVPPCFRYAAGRSPLSIVFGVLPRAVEASGVGASVSGMVVPVVKLANFGYGPAIGTPARGAFDRRVGFCS
jgi:hypothetical protein